MNVQVSNLTKVTLSFKVLNAKNGSQLAGPASFTFIFGAASDGFCPMETGLFKKSRRESLLLSVAAKDMQKTFGYLLPGIKRSLNLQISPEIMLFEITVVEVASADEREIVKAIAAAISGGCGGDCGCGCS